MIGVEDGLEGREDNNRGGSLKPRRAKKRRMGDRDEVGSLRNMKMAEESRRCMTAEAEGMKVGDPVRVSRAGLRNGGESEELQLRSRLYGLKILQGKNVLYDSLLF
jgi:hypothetical protein